LIFIADLKDCDRVLYGLIEEMIEREENRIGLSEVKKQLTDMLSAKLTCDSSEPDKVLFLLYNYNAHIYIIDSSL
jgi:hypothetical protein